MRESLNVFLVDGETKTGKGSASKEIYETLSREGLSVYYDVAGDFYRRYVAVVRDALNLSEEDELPTGDRLQRAAQQVYNEDRVPFEPDDRLGDLQRTSLSNSVSTLGELAIAQRAGYEWWSKIVAQAWEKKADALVVDARNPRARLIEQELKEGISLRFVLDLYMQCEPTEAARRTLLGKGVNSPTDEEIAAEQLKVIDRRKRDRRRPVNPFVMPTIIEKFVPGKTAAEDIISLSWQPRSDVDLPIAILLDNSTIAKPEMLAIVSELAVSAAKFSETSLADA